MNILFCEGTLKGIYLYRIFSNIGSISSRDYVFSLRLLFIGIFLLAGEGRAKDAWDVSSLIHSPILTLLINSEC